MPEGDPCLDYIYALLKDRMPERIYQVWFAPEKLALTREDDHVVGWVASAFG